MFFVRRVWRARVSPGVGVGSARGRGIWPMIVQTPTVSASVGRVVYWFWENNLCFSKVTSKSNRNCNHIRGICAQAD